MRAATHRPGLAETIGASSRERHLLLDVSIIAVNDAGTGIQRVVRSITLNLLKNPPAGMTVKLVHATRKRPYRYANHYMARLMGQEPVAEDTLVDVEPGDIFLGLDLTNRPLPLRQPQLHQWRRRGVRCAFVVYDLLPVMHPAWFTPIAGKAFHRWLETLAIHADALFCISQSVASDVEHWFDTHYQLSKSDVSIDWFHLGADIPSAADVLSARNRSIDTLIGSRSGPVILMVGTVEPRKGHARVLDAFERIWSDGDDATLVIAGRAGWRVEALLARLAALHDKQANLVWLGSASDDDLCTLYAGVDGVIMASEAEGFGLPLVEAAQWGMPILANDLPVFREVAGNHATYFRADSGDELATQLQAWLRKLRADEATKSSAMPRLTWEQSAAKLSGMLERLAPHSGV